MTAEQFRQFAWQYPRRPALPSHVYLSLRKGFEPRLSASESLTAGVELLGNVICGASPWCYAQAQDRDVQVRERDAKFWRRQGVHLLERAARTQGFDRADEAYFLLIDLHLSTDLPDGALPADE